MNPFGWIEGGLNFGGRRIRQIVDEIIDRFKSKTFDVSPTLPAIYGGIGDPVVIGEFGFLPLFPIKPLIHSLLPLLTF